MGDGGAAEPQNNVLRIVNGGWLTAGGTVTSWNAIGWTKDAGVMIVEKGGLLTNNEHLYVAGSTGGKGRLVIDGGTVYIADAIQFGRPNSVAGYIDINAGTLSARYTATYTTPSNLPRGDSRVDIGFGKWELRGGENSDRDYTQALINAGKMVAFGGFGTVNLALVGGNWTATAASDPMNRDPGMDAYVHTNAALPLSWKNLDPNKPGDPVYVDVWFGTDPTWIPEPNELLPGYPGHYVDFAKIVTAGVNTETAIVDASVDTEEYFWRVDNYRYGEPNDTHFPVNKGIKMYFTATSDFPPASVVIDTPSMVTWINKPIHLSATVTDDNVSTPTIVWSANKAGVPINEPNAVFTNKQYMYNGDGTGTATADVTVDYHSAQFNVVVTVSDASPLGGSVSDTASHDCAESACQATRVLGYGDSHPADFDENCVINIADLQRLALDWLKDYEIEEPSEI
jgi:hypothetical protein